MTEDGLRERGNAAAKLGDWKMAERAYSDAIVADPKDGLAWSNRALAYLKLGQPLLAYGDAQHAYECWTPRNVKAAARLGMACDAMQLHEQAEQAFSMCLYFPLDAATRRDIEERLAKAKEARIAKVAEDAATTMKLHPGAHKSAALDAAGEERMMKGVLASGLAPLPCSYRGGEGGPRHPSAVIEAFGSGFSTDLVALTDMGPKGVGVVATRDIPARALLHVDTPLLATSMQGLRPGGLKDCYHCTRPAPAASAVPCACDRVFCSVACKGAAMALYHAPLCAMGGGTAVARLEERASAGSTASSRYLLMMWKMLGASLVRSKATGRLVESPPDAPPFCHLARRSDWPSPDPGTPLPMMSAAYVARTWQLMRELVTEPLRMEPGLSIRWVCDSVGLLGANVIGLTGTGWPSIVSCGQALMGAGSFFNHSCVPNCKDVSDSDKAGAGMYFFAERALKKGEELTIAYCDTDVPREHRQQTLDAQYAFECDCPKCRTEA